MFDAKSVVQLCIERSENALDKEPLDKLSCVQGRVSFVLSFGGGIVSLVGGIMPAVGVAFVSAIGGENFDFVVCTGL